MIPSHRAPDHVSCLQLGSTRERVYCFWLVRSIKRIFPEYWTPERQREQQYPQLALGPVPDHWLRGRLSGGGVRTPFSHMATPSSCTPGFSIKRIFPEYWPRGPGIYRTLLQYPHGPVPEHCLLSRDVSPLGSPGTGLLCPFIPWGSIKRIFPEYQKTFLYLVAGVSVCS